MSSFLPQTESKMETMNDSPAEEVAIEEGAGYVVALKSELGIIKSDVESIKAELSRVKTAGNFTCVAVDVLV